MANTSIIAEQDLSRDLYESNAGYRQYYGQMNYAKQATEDASATSYNDAITKAYMSGQKNKAALKQTDYGSGAANQLNSRLNETLMSAYEQYRAKHTQGVSEATATLDEGIASVNEQLHKTGRELGTNYAKYQEGAFRWLEDLKRGGYFNDGGQFDSYQEYVAWKDQLAADYPDYETYKLDYESQYPKGYDSAGNYIPMLTQEQFESEKLSEGQWRAAWAKQQVFKDVFNKDGSLNEDALKTAIFSELDEDGNIKTDESGNPIVTGDLNIRGIEMLDRLNALDSKEYGTYSEWLSKNDKDLYMWSVQRAMLGNGTNASAAMENLGSDGVYSFMERFGGLTQSQTEELFSEFQLATERMMMNENGRATHWKTFNQNGEEVDAEGVSSRNIQALGEATKVMTDLYSALDIDNAVYTISTKDGENIELTQNEMITLQFAEAVGITAEEAGKLLGTGDFDKLKGVDFGSSDLYSGAISAGVVAAISGAIAIKGTIAAGAATTGALLGTAGASASVPVVGWVVAGIALIAAAVSAGIGLSEQRKENKENTKKINAQEGAIRRAFDQWAVQSASVGYEMRRKAQGLS